MGIFAILLIFSIFGNSFVKGELLQDDVFKLYLFKRAVTLTNSGSDVADAEVLIFFDTSSLVEDQHIKSDCSDFAFALPDNTEAEFFIEGGCGSSTAIWIKIPNFLSGSIILTMYYGEDTSNPTQISWPGGAFFVMNSEACVSPWTHANALNNLYIRAGSVYGFEDGNPQHEHSIDSHTTQTVDIVGNRCANGSPTAAEALHPIPGGGTHSHHYTGDADRIDNEPAYIQGPFCSSRYLSLQEGMYVMFNSRGDALPTGFSYASEFENRLIKASAIESKSPGGLFEHSHTYTMDPITFYGSTPTHNNCVGSAPQKNVTLKLHNHSPRITLYGVNTTESFPPYRTMAFARVLATGIFGKGYEMAVPAKKIPPIGWKEFPELTNKFPMGGFVAGKLGGSEEHSHVIRFDVTKHGTLKLILANTNTDYNEQHNHDILYDKTSIASNYPEFIDLKFIERKDSPFAVTIGDQQVHNDNGQGGNNNNDNLTPFEQFINSFWWLFLVGGIGLIMLAILVVVSLIILGYFAFRRQGKPLKKMDTDMELETTGDHDHTPNFKINKKLFEIEYEDVILKKEIGRGGSGAVIYAGTWGGKQVAFKVFKTKDITSQLVFDEFEKEVQVMSSISHPNILTFYGCSIRQPRIGIVMEYCENGSLSHYVQKYLLDSKDVKPLTNDQKVNILKEISSGVMYMHERNIIHRDMKCENVLLNKDLIPKIIDFGLSKIMKDKVNNMTRSIGTLFYMAPEVIGKSDYGLKCDVYSFAIIIWELMHEDFTPYKIDGDRILAKVASDPNYRPEIDNMRFGPENTWLIELMQRCWKYEAKDRPTFKQVFAAFSKERLSVGKKI